MANLFGFEVATPQIDISGFLSSSWIYVFVIVIIGMILVIGVAIMLFLMTYKRKVILFENVSGMGYQPVLRTRARVIKLGAGGEEVIRTLAGKHYVSAYGRKMGKNTYWYCKGSDGYWYNIVLGDLDTKLAMLDIEPVDKDVRMFHVAVEKLSSQDYGRKVGVLEKYGVHMIFLVMVIVMLSGFWIIAGKINEGLVATVDAAKINQKTAEIQQGSLSSLSNIGSGSSGVVSAGDNG